MVFYDKIVYLDNQPYKILTMNKLTVSFLILVITSFSGFSQSFLEAYQNTRVLDPAANLNGLNNDAFRTLTGNSAEFSKIMGILGEFDDINLAKKGIEGTVMMFDRRENHKGRLYSDKKVYIVKDVNYNIERGHFQSKLENDSTFIYNLETVKRVVIKDRDFSVMYNPAVGKRQIYEVIQAGKKVSLVKGHYIKLLKASPNPMVNRKTTKIQQKWKYYIIDSSDKIVEFSGKKKALLNSVKSEDKRKQLKDYISKNRLKVSRVDDLKKIFEYYNTL